MEHRPKASALRGAGAPCGSPDSPNSRTAEDHQREAARIMLQAMAGRGFALAGSSAIREHGITKGPTADVDLFTADTDPDWFAEAVDAGADALRENGYQVVVARRAEQFARFAATALDGSSFDIDMGVDWDTTSNRDL